MYVIETVAYSEPSGVILLVGKFERSGIADDSSSPIKSRDPAASSPHKTPVLKAPVSSLPVTPVVSVPDSHVPTLDSPYKSHDPLASLACKMPALDAPVSPLPVTPVVPEPARPVPSLDSSLKSHDPPGFSSSKTPVLKAPVSTLPVTPVVPELDPQVPSLDSPINVDAESVVSNSLPHRDVVVRTSATPSPEKITKDDSDPLILEMEVQELADKLQGVVEEQQRMGTVLNKVQETQHALLSRQDEICDHFYRLDRQLQRLEYWRYSSSGLLETSPATRSSLDLQLPSQSPPDKFWPYGSTPKRNLAGRQLLSPSQENSGQHFLPPSQENSTFSSRAINPHSSTFSFRIGQEPVTPAQPSSKESPLPLPFNNSNLNVLQ